MRRGGCWPLMVKWKGEGKRVVPAVMRAMTKIARVKTTAKATMEVIPVTKGRSLTTDTTKIKMKSMTIHQRPLKMM